MQRIIWPHRLGLVAPGLGLRAAFGSGWHQHAAIGMAAEAGAPPGPRRVL